MNQGISILQGPHQVAQKFSSTTLPAIVGKLHRLPLASFRVKSGAVLRSFSGLTAARTDVPGFEHAVMQDNGDEHGSKLAPGLPS